MRGITAVLLGGALSMMTVVAMAAGPSAAPDPQAEIKACQAKCDESESETDRATCRLNCRHAVEGKDRPHIIRWTEERSVGGRVPGQGAAPPPTRTVTTVTPRGTTTKTTTVEPSGGAKSKPAPTTSAGTTTTALPSPRHRYYFGLVSCQDKCNSIKIGVDRARCKLRCFRQHPGPAPARTTAYAPKKRGNKPKATSKPAAPAAKTKAKPAAPAVSADKAWAACKTQCASEASEDDRGTCEAQCWDRAKRKTGAQ